MNAEECLELILSCVETTSDYEEIGLGNLRGRTLAEDIAATSDVPPFRKSAMDGYAVRSSDLASADSCKPARLTVKGELFAGDFAEFGGGEPGTAVRVMTGSYVPEGYDAVVKQESTDYGMTEVSVFESAKSGMNVCQVGEDVRKDDLIMKMGDVLTPLHESVLASLGITKAKVARKPKFFIVSTGSELTRASEKPAPGKIRESISYLLTSSLASSGAEIAGTAICKDDEDELAKTISMACGGADFVITTGGVSVGKKDLLPKVLSDMGAEKLFAGANIQPGTPTMAAVLDGKIILCLSGNPYAAFANFELYAWEMTKKFLGARRAAVKKAKAVLLCDYPKTSKRLRRLRAHACPACELGESRRRDLDSLQLGKFSEALMCAYLLGSNHKASVISDLTHCNCFIDVSPDTPLKKGDIVDIVFFRQQP